MLNTSINYWEQEEQRNKLTTLFSYAEVMEKGWRFLHSDNSSYQFECFNQFVYGIGSNQYLSSCEANNQLSSAHLNCQSVFNGSYLDKRNIKQNSKLVKSQ